MSPQTSKNKAPTGKQKQANAKTQMPFHIGSAEKCMWVSVHRLPHLYLQPDTSSKKLTDTPAGQLQVQQEVKASTGVSEKSKKWLVRASAVGTFCTWFLMAGVITEGVRWPVLMAQSAHMQRELELMRQEQAFLMQKTALPQRYIGVGSVWSFSDSSAYYAPQGVGLKGFEGYTFADSFATDALKFTGLFENKGYVGIGKKMQGKNEDYVRFVARHELAHQWQQEQRLGMPDYEQLPQIKKQVSDKEQGAPMMSALLHEQLQNALVLPMDKNWRKQWNKEYKQYQKERAGQAVDANDINDEHDKPKVSSGGLSLLHDTYVEAYADAYALLIKTHDPNYKSGQMVHEALVQMYGRIHGLTQDSLGSALIAGEGHSVSEVGAQIAYLDERQVQALSALQVQQLAQSIATRATLISFAKSASFIDGLDELQKIKWIHMQRYGAEQKGQPIGPEEQARWEQGFKEFQKLVGYDERLGNLWDGVGNKNAQPQEQEEKQKLLQKQLRIARGASAQPQWMTRPWSIKLQEHALVGLGELPDPLGHWREHGVGGLIRFNEAQDKIKIHPLFKYYTGDLELQKESPEQAQVDRLVQGFKGRIHVQVDTLWALHGLKDTRDLSRRGASIGWSLNTSTGAPAAEQKESSVVVQKKPEPWQSMVSMEPKIEDTYFGLNGSAIGALDNRAKVGVAQKIPLDTRMQQTMAVLSEHSYTRQLVQRKGQAEALSFQVQVLEHVRMFEQLEHTRQSKQEHHQKEQQKAIGRYEHWRSQKGQGQGQGVQSPQQMVTIGVKAPRG